MVVGANDFLYLFILQRREKNLPVLMSFVPVVDVTVA